MTNKRKKKIRALVDKTGGSYQGGANALRAPRARQSKRFPFKRLERLLAGLVEQDVRWVLRGDPELASRIVDRDFASVGYEDHDYLYQVMSQLQHPHHRAMALAQSLVDEFDAFFAWSRFTNTDLTSRALFNAGVNRMYFRFGRDKLDACIGHLVLASDPVSLFKDELEPLLKHAQNFRGSIFVEVMELPPKLDAQLGPYLTGTGWADSSLCPETQTYGGRKGEAYCRPGFDFVDAPTRSHRMQFEHWRRIQLERSSLKSRFRDAHLAIRAAIRAER